MKITSFNEDLIGLETFANKLKSFIDTEVDFVEGSLVVGLTSKYGSGKTTFLEMWKSLLEDETKTNNNIHVISLNAWESDYYGDPLFAIISAMVDALRKDGESVNKLINAAKDLGWFTTAIGGQIVNKLTGIDPIAAGDITESKKLKRENSDLLIPDAFSEYESRKDAMSSLKHVLNQYISSSEPKVMFLVDELDRCRPDYAITYLETIKHIFDIKGAVFIIAADRNHLENSARTAFGQKLDFEEYYRKFIHREVTLPPISDSGYEKLISNYINYYLERDGSRFCYLELDSTSILNLKEFIGGLKLTPRQTQEAYRILGHICDTSEVNRGKLRWCLGLASIVMTSLKVGRPDIFESISTRKNSSEEILIFLKQIVSENNVEWWFTLFLTGGCIKTDGNQKFEDILKQVGFLSDDHDTSQQLLYQWSNGWGRSYNESNTFNEIYTKIQQISKWN